MEIRRKVFFTGIILMLFMASCSIEPQPISYGNDHCEYCKMSIVDERYGAELVTDKGKIFKFDAVECLINYKNENNIVDPAYLLVTGYTNPGELIPAEESYYLKSAELPSPMGANLTAFKEETIASEFQSKYPGEIYSWNELLNQFEQLRN